MRALIEQDLRKLVGPVLGFVAFFALLGLGGHFFPEWLRPVLTLYGLGAGAFALYLGADAMSGESTRQVLAWESVWPVTRRAWWLTKFVTTLAVCLVVGGLLHVLVTSLLGPQAQADPKTRALLAHAGRSLWLLVTLFAVSFSVSALARSSLEAFGASLGLLVAWQFTWSLVALLPMRLVLALGGEPVLPTTWAMGLPALLMPLSLLAGSYYGFVSTPLLEAGRRLRRAFAVPVLALLVAVPLVLVPQLGFLIRPRPLSDHIAAATLSPDGTQLAFVDGFISGSVWLLKTDGTGLHRLAPGRYLDLLWLSDSRRLLTTTDARTRRPRFRGRTGNPQDNASPSRECYLLDTATGAKPAELPVKPNDNGGGLLDARLSPGGKYLLSSGQFLDVATWRVCGQVEVPNVSPWLLTWLPDDSAIYVVEHQQQPRWQSVLKRIAVPSGTVTTLAMPSFAPTGNMYQSMPEVYSPGEASPWLYGRRWRYVAPARQRSDCHVDTVFFRPGSPERFVVPDLTPLSGGLSPDARYCLMTDNNNGATSGLGGPLLPAPADGAPFLVCLYDMTQRRVARRFALTPLAQFDRLERLLWSCDSRRVGLLTEHWSKQSPRTSLEVLGVDGSRQTIQYGTSFSMPGRTNLPAWSSTGEIIVAEAEKRLVALGLDGSRRLLYEAPDPWRELKARAGAAKAK